MIKLTPEHVGTRVWLSDGEVGFVSSHDAQANEYKINGDGFYFRAEQDDERITLFLDAPNPMDVEVPEWCEDVVVWYHDAAIQILDREQFQDWRRASHEQPPQGWSPAPCQMPPKNNEEYN